jgi:rhodanese-related sulfurtransferase
MRPMTDSPAEIPVEIDVHAVKRMLDQGDDFLLLDCRGEDEHQIARIDGATLIPMQQLPERVGELAPHQQRPIVVHCHHGGRSLRVTHWLRNQGFRHVQNMTGGIDAWSLEVDNSVARY